MTFVKPRVTMIAQTVPSAPSHILQGNEIAAAEWLDPQPGSSKAEYITEFAGRACYQSFDRPNPATAKTEDYIQRTLFDQGHWSIAEHASVTFYITGVSRAFTHELIRHRHLSYSQLSQRFVDESDLSLVTPPALEDLYDNDTSVTADFDYATEAAQESYQSLVEKLLSRGLTRKQAREAARSVLPNATETRIVVTGNLRAWHEFCERRMQPDADAEMQKVATMIYDELSNFAPTIFLKVEEEEEKETTEEELEQARIDDLMWMVDGTIARCDGDLFVKRYFGWQDVVTDEPMSSTTLAKKGNYEIIYRAV